MNSIRLFKTWSNFKALCRGFEYLSVFIDDNITRITMVCCCSNKIFNHSNKVKRGDLAQRWKQYLSWKTALTAHLLLLYQYSQTPSLLTFLLRHHFQSHCLELSLELTVVRMYLYVCLTPFLFWGFQKFIIFTKLWNYKK